MTDDYVSIEDGTLYCLRTELSPERQTILFIHGLGDSSISFREAFESPALRGFNLVAPDLLGYGRSSAGGQHGQNGENVLQAHRRRLFELLRKRSLLDVFVVGHSLGGDIGTLMAEEAGEVRGFVNVEGNLTPTDLFISSQAVAAATRNEFDQWLRTEFQTRTVLEDWGSTRESCRRYYASLWFCRGETFLADSRGLCDANGSLPDTAASQLGERFRELSIPKLFCWGRMSLSPRTQQFLRGSDIPHREFRDASHWVMVDQSNDFYHVLADFVRTPDA